MDTESTTARELRLVLPEADREFAYQFLSDRESYHHHKETSAYTIFAVEAAFFTALLTADWYSAIGRELSYPKPVAIAVIAALWILIHRFLRWQLINRRIAALQVKTLITALLDTLGSKDSTVETTASERVKSGGRVNAFLDRWLWPVYVDALESDSALREYPPWYRDRFREFQSSKETVALTGEMFPTIGSLLLFVLFVLYVLLVL